MREDGDTPTAAPLGRVLAGAALGGTVAGAATGVIDGLWSWQGLEQFLPDFAGKARLLLFLAACYGLAGYLVGAAAGACAAFFSRATRLGDLVRFAWRTHAEIRAREPRDAVIGLSLVIAGVPLVAAALGGAFLYADYALAERKHMGLILASAMVLAVIAVAAAALATFAVARPIEALLRRLAAHESVAAPLSSPWAPALAGVALLGITATIAAVWTWETLSLLHLRPLAVLALAGALAVPSLRIGNRLAAALARRRRAARRGAMAGVAAGLAALLLLAGGAEGVRKAGNGYTGLGGPLTRLFRTLGDFDRDGHSRVLGGGDCNDWDASIHPGAADIPFDGIDQNCVDGDATLGRDTGELGFATLPDTVPRDLNVILLTIDTLRADHVGAYGYERDTTPNIDRVAATGTLFVNSWAHAPSTRYSMPAILTGRYPLDVAYDYSIKGWPGLLPRATTIAEVLKGRGMATAAILNYWYFDRHRRMDQGFDTYDNSNKRLHKGVPGEGPAHTRGSSSKEQTDKALELLDRHADEPFFLWVHYYDPHYEYEAHDEVPSFGSGREDLYDQEIRFTDHHVGRLLDDLERRGLADETVIVITGDHGEGFGEHGIDLHGYHLYAAQTKVPLIVRVPGVEPRRVTTPVAHVDILPTLANLAGADPSEDMMGRSLVDVITGQAPADDDRWVFQQLSYENDHEMRAAASKQCHVIYNVSPDTSWELYRIDTDPLERRDVIDSPGPCGEARSVLEAWYDRPSLPPGATDALLDERPDVADPLDVVFGSEVALLEAAPVPATVRPGDTIELALTFEARGRLSEDWGIFVHFDGPGSAFFQGDHAPPWPLHYWTDGQHIRYRHTVTVPSSARPGDYQVWLGLWNKSSHERLGVRSRDVRVDENRAAIGTLKVTR